MFAQVKLRPLFLLALFSIGIIIISIPLNYASAWNAGAAGDWGCSSNTPKTLTTIRNQGPERIFALGDYSYQSTATCWLNIINPVKSITRIAIGNHEDDSNEDFSKYMSSFGLTSTYYSISNTVENSITIVMDSDHSSYSSGSSQYNFVLNELKKPFKWKIVYIHKQFYTSPNTCSSSSCSNTGSDATNLRNIYQKWFDQYGVDLVLMGHVHNYQRTFPIKYDSGSPSSPIITSTSSTDYTDPTGEIFALVGTGGVNFHALSGKSSFVKYQQDDRFGALDISIENSGNTLAGRYYTNDGVKRDTFKINKGTSLASYSFGPSLSLSGEAPTSTVQSDKGSIGLSGGDLQPNQGQDNSNQGQDNNNQPGQSNGQGKGLECEHFKNQGPERCRNQS